MLSTLGLCSFCADGLADVAQSEAAASAAERSPLVTEQDAISTIFVWGRREGSVGQATSASEGSVSYGSFVDRPLLRTGEIAEVIPGLAVTQHSGSGKANQYFLRGFNLDHGTDFSVSLNGAPLNLRTNAHGQGYLDLNVMIPELVDHIRYKKGPYFADTGDFSAAGSAAFFFLDTTAERFVTLTSGEHGYGRVLGVSPVSDRSYMALDVTTSSGPWEQSENLKRGDLVYHQSLGNWGLTALGYTGSWNSTDQIPLRAVQRGIISRLGNIDPTDGGNTSRLLLTAQMQETEGSTASIYLQRYQLSLWSDFTYFLDNPVNGDQFEQAESRWIVGGAAAKTWDSSGEWAFTVGGDTRYDRIGKIGLYRTHARSVLSTDREDKVDQGSGAAYAAASWHRAAWRATVGIRYDAMGVKVAAGDSRNSGSEWDGLASPKVTVAYRVSDRLELYADLGRGFHSNDARGAVMRVAPVSGEPVIPVNLLVPALGGEIGARYERDGLSASIAVWGLKLDSELLYSGDAGDTESRNASQRLGGEALVNWTPMRGVNFDLSAATTHARYAHTEPGADRIPNALRYVVTAGVSLAFSPNASAELTARRLGPAPLTEDGSISSGTSTLTNLLYRYNFSRVSVFSEVLNVFDRNDNDITYFYTSRLPGELAAGVAGIHFHPMEPRTFRIGLKYSM